MSVQSHEKYSAEVDAAINRLVSMHLQASDTYLSIAFYFESASMAPQGMGRFFRELAEEKRDDAYRLLMESQRRGRALFPEVQKVPQGEWRGSLDAMEASVAMERNLNQAFLDLHALGSANSDAFLCDFLQSHFLEKEVKLMKKLGDQLMNLRKLVEPEVDLGEYLFKTLTLKCD